MNKLRLLIFIFFIFFLPKLANKAYAAKLYLDPPTGTYKAGAQFESRIMVDTEGAQAAGVDVHINFDPTILKVNNIEKGEIFDQYLGKNIDNDNGFLSISGITSMDATSGYTGTGVFAKILFEGIREGSSEVKFDFSPSDKNDSNVAGFQSAEDILSSTGGATYTISAAASGGSSGGGSGGTGGTGGSSDSGTGGENTTTTTTPSELPQSGNFSTTLKAILGGISILTLSFFLLL